MKAFFSKLMKDTRGVVMMEYIVLGCFAVAITVVAVLALGKVYNNGLVTMAYATLGNTDLAVQAQLEAETALDGDVGSATDYAGELAQSTEIQKNFVDFTVYK